MRCILWIRGLYKGLGSRANMICGGLYRGCCRDTWLYESHSKGCHGVLNLKALDGSCLLYRRAGYVPMKVHLVAKNLLLLNVQACCNLLTITLHSLQRRVQTPHVRSRTKAQNKWAITHWCLRVTEGVNIGTSIGEYIWGFGIFLCHSLAHLRDG